MNFQKKLKLALIVFSISSSAFAVENNEYFLCNPSAYYVFELGSPSKTVVCKDQLSDDCKPRRIDKNLLQANGSLYIWEQKKVGADLDSEKYFELMRGSGAFKLTSKLFRKDGTRVLEERHEGICEKKVEELKF